MPDTYTRQVLDKANMANLPPVSGCHRCGNSENPAHTFTLAPGKRWLCQSCLRQLDQTDLDQNDPNHPLLAYVDQAMREARLERSQPTNN